MLKHDMKIHKLMQQRASSISIVSDESSALGNFVVALLNTNFPSQGWKKV